MSVKSALLKARGSLVFLIGLTVAFGTVYSLESHQPAAVTVVAPAVKINDDKQLPLVIRRSLTENEMAYASTAWKYFANNTNSETGLVNSVDNYPAATLWDTSSYLLGLIAAHRLEIVDASEFNARVSKLLGSLATLPLFDDQLPNKSYSTIDLSMVTYNNDATERGIGWSAIDIGRVLVPFNVLVWHYPQFTGDINKVLSRWDLTKIVRNAEMYGAAVDESGKTKYLQEGRLGYEEYAAKSLMLSGVDLSAALNYEKHFKYVDVSGVAVGTDLRTPDRFDAINAVVSEPYVLDGVEYGWDRYSRSLANSIYRAQAARYEETGTLTAVSEDNIDKAPYFVYNTVFADGKPWNAVTETGEDASAFRSVSTKTVFGLHALFNTPYTGVLMDAIKNNYNDEKGWYSGIYEATGEPNESLTANTNGIILESLHYIRFGPLLGYQRAPQTAAAE